MGWTCGLEAMPRPRFLKLSEAKRAHILDVASEEFAENGFEGASYNRIIERAGLSKGAMYYYFDDKMDLYGTVMQAAFQEMMSGIKVPVAEDVPGFWAELVQYYLHSWQLAIEQPRLVALTRGLMEHPERWREGPLAEMFAEIMAFTEGLIDRGQQLGAVRDDLHRDLLVAVAFGVGEAMDRWSFTNIDRVIADGQEATAQRLVGLFRRVLEP